HAAPDLIRTHLSWPATHAYARAHHAEGIVAPDRLGHAAHARLGAVAGVVLVAKRLAPLVGSGGVRQQREPAGRVIRARADDGIVAVAGATQPAGPMVGVGGGARIVDPPGAVARSVVHRSQGRSGGCHPSEWSSP